MAISLGVAGCSLFVDVDGLTGADSSTTDAAGDSNDESDPDGGPDREGLDASDGGDTGTNAALFGCDAEAQASLVGYFPLDETSGSVVHDCSGSGNDGTISGPFTWTTGANAKLGGALQFSAGDAGCVDFPSSVFDFGGFPAGPFTTAFWINLTDNAADGQRSFLTGKSSDPTAGGWRVSAETDLSIHLAIPNDASGTSVGTATGIPLGQWKHVAVVFNGTNVTIYVNAVSAVSKNVPSGFARDSTSGDHMRLGCSSDSQHYTRGVFDEVRYYTRALGADELLALYRGP